MAFLDKILELFSVRYFTTCRWGIGFISFVGVTFLYAMRVNFSVAIVCMVQTPNATNPIHGVADTNSTDLTTNNSSEEQKDFKCQYRDGIHRQVYGKDAEFSWDRSLQSKLLASFYYGYIVTQIPGGWLARRYGSRRVVGYSFVVLVLATMLLPFFARLHLAMAFALRIVAGLASGLVFPALSCLWGRWAPPYERTKLFSLQSAGMPLGSIVTLSVSGFLCDHGFDNGWGSIFYITGLAGLLWIVVWFVFVYDSPAKHPRISEKEKEYIESSIGDSFSGPDGKEPTPWRKMFTSTAVWAIVVAHVCTNWTAYTLVTGLPSYMQEVLDFDIKENGVLSAIPYICSATTAPLVGYVADTIREREIVNTKNTRRIFESISSLGTAIFMVLAGFVTCHNRFMAVVYLSLATTCLDFVKAGHAVNVLDIAPRFAGEILGISNTVATLPGMIAPITNGFLTPNGAQEEWQIVFFMCAGFSVFKLLVFVIFVKGNVQSWATGSDTPHAQTKTVIQSSKEMVTCHAYDNAGGVFEKDSNKLDCPDVTKY